MMGPCLLFWDFGPGARHEGPKPETQRAERGPRAGMRFLEAVANPHKLEGPRSAIKSPSGPGS